MDWDEFLSTGSTDAVAWPRDLDETAAMGLCYTSGTTPPPSLPCDITRESLPSLCHYKGIPLIPCDITRESLSSLVIFNMLAGTTGNPKGVAFSQVSQY